MPLRSVNRKIRLTGAGPVAAVSHRARKSLRAAGFPPPRHPRLVLSG